MVNVLSADDAVGVLLDSIGEVSKLYYAGKYKEAKATLKQVLEGIGFRERKFGLELELSNGGVFVTSVCSFLHYHDDSPELAKSYIDYLANLKTSK